MPRPPMKTKTGPNAGPTEVPEQIEHPDRDREYPTGEVIEGMQELKRTVVVVSCEERMNYAFTVRAYAGEGALPTEDTSDEEDHLEFESIRLTDDLTSLPGPGQLFDMYFVRGAHSAATVPYFAIDMTQRGKPRKSRAQ